MTTPIRTSWILSVACIAAFVAGCVGQVSDPVSDAEHALTARAWPSVTEESWSAAAEGCEGVSLDHASFAVDEATDLVIAFSEDGTARCVDSADAVIDQIASNEGAEAARDAREGYMGSLASREMARPTSDAPLGDPNPKPVSPLGMARPATDPLGTNPTREDLGGGMPETPPLPFPEMGGAPPR